MIHINLLIKPKPTNWRRVGIILGSVLLVGVVGIAGVRWWFAYRSVTTELRALNDLIGDYQGKMSLEADLTAKEAVMQKELGAVKGFGRNQGSGKQSAVLEAIFSAGSAGVTVSGISFKPDGTIDINGKAAKWDQAIAFRDGLRKMSIFSGVAENNYAGSNGETTFTFTATVSQGVSK